jgi:carboxyl-terminal processing protease
MSKLLLSAILLFSGLKLMAQSLHPIVTRSADINTITPLARGIWKSIGDSYLLDARNDTIILYSTTSQHCYTEKNEHLTGLLNTRAQFRITPAKDTLSIFLQDFGDRTSTLQSENKYYRLPSLPANCHPLTDAQKGDPEFLFDLFWVTLRENYAHSVERNINWNEIYLHYRPKLSPLSTKYDLFEIMGQIVTSTKDQHTKIIAENGETKQYRGEPSSRLLKESFEDQDSIKTFDEYIDRFFGTSYQNISDYILHGKGKKVANGKIEWGDVSESIGYIAIHSFTRFTKKDVPRGQQIDTLNLYMNEIMKSFQNKKAIIVDVSFNFGGYDAAGLTIASYFTRTQREAFTTYKYQNGRLYKGTAFSVNPSEAYNFTKPVFLLTTDISRSAAESFAVQMKALPNVTIVGTNTLGILSSMLNKSIGEFILTISNENYITPDGKTYEVSGVDPDIRLDIFTKQNMFNGHRDAVRKVIALIDAKIKESTK